MKILNKVYKLICKPKRASKYKIKVEINNMKKNSKVKRNMNIKRRMIIDNYKKRGIKNKLKIRESKRTKIKRINR
jgi:hypothetical protein